MKIQQLIVESKGSADCRENAIVGKSSGIEPELLEEATKWSTAYSGILIGQRSTIFYCPSKQGTGLIGRSYGGGFDSEGNRPLRTHFVLATSNQLKCYYNNPVLIARALNSSGAWFLKTTDVEAELFELELPDHVVNTFAYPDQVEQVKRTRDAIKINDQIAVTDASRPLDFVGQVLQSYGFGERSKVSFAIDRRIAAATPFQINAYSSADTRLEHDLSQHNVCPVRLRTKPVRAN